MSVTVAIVDDSRTMRSMLGYTLRDAGFTVIEAEDGQQGLELLTKQQANIVITDLNMPVMDGFGLVRGLRATAQYQNIPILMLTTESSQEQKDKGRAAGATGWLVKPFKPEKLVAVIHKVLG